MDELEDVIPVPRSAVLPIELRPPPGFRADDPATWPRVEGKLEYVGGRLLYMPPSGDVQQFVCVDVVWALRDWANQHPDHLVGSNETGMILGGDTRAADAAIWRRTDVSFHGGYHRVPPILAIEVAGRDEDEAALREKALWYLGHGVPTVWLVLPVTREVVVLAAGTDERFGVGEQILAPVGLPDLGPRVDELFKQLP